jgi:hypothetical protein
MYLVKPEYTKYVTDLPIGRKILLQGPAGNKFFFNILKVLTQFLLFFSFFLGGDRDGNLSREISASSGTSVQGFAVDSGFFSVGRR